MQIELVILLVMVVVVLILGYIITYPFKGSVPETSVSDKQRDMLLRKFSTSERKKTNVLRLKEAHTIATNNGTLCKVSKGTVEGTEALRLFEECFAKAMTKNKIEQSGKTHIANYTKYRYTGSSIRDVEIYHQPTQQWVFYYLMFSTPFEDSSLKCNGVDVTGCNSAETSPMSLRDVFASPEYDDSTTRNNRYSDDYSSSSNSDYSSSSYSSSDSGSSSSYSSSSD